MTKLKALLWLIALSQFALGALVLAVPGAFLGWMGLTVPPADTGYILGMLGACFIAYGFGMVVLARAAEPDRFWLLNMALVQAIDFSVGLVYLADGRITLSTAAFPMTNALVFTSLILLLAPRATEKGAAA